MYRRRNVNSKKIDDSIALKGSKLENKAVSKPIY